MTAPKLGIERPVGAGCLVLFLLPFAFIGGFTGLKAIQLLHRGNWREALLYILFALVFGGAGFGGLLGIRVALRQLKQEQELKAAHPNEPWLWRAGWASRRIEDSSRVDLLGAWIFALFWNLVSSPAGYLGLRAALEEGKPAAAVALLFPLIGLGLLGRAIQLSLRKRKYGVSRFELDTLPAAIGEKLAGTVRATMEELPPGPFLAELTSIRQTTTRSGKSSSTSEGILWQEQQQVRGEQIRDASGMGVRIPISFRLPSDLEPWDISDSRNKVLWRLRVSAELPGVDYAATFEVPVFRTAAGELPSEQADAEESASLAAYRQPVDSKVIVTTSRGATEILFPPARNIGAATGLTLFTIFWWSTIVIQVYLRAPIVFPIVTALFGALLTIGALDLWLKVSRITADPSAITVSTGYLQPGRERRISAGDVADVVPAIGMQAGSTVYYDVEIRRKDGKKVTAGHSIRDKREAEWLAATIKKALGR
jgi:hypothetical protein